MREADGRARRPTPYDGTRAPDCRSGKKFTSAGGSGWLLRLLLTALLVIAAADPAAARPSPFDALPSIEIPLEPEDQRRGGSALSWHTTFDDTVLYGGTVWSPDSMRWEALRDSHWTFDTGVGSSINTGANPNKPIGYHQTMEGWFGIDRTLNPQPYFRRSSTCAISGSFSLWAGVTAVEAGVSCYASGQGYGNSWELTATRDFLYDGLGSVSLSFDYATECEPSYDYLFVQVDTTGTAPLFGSDDWIPLWGQDGNSGGTIVLSLVPGQTMRSTPGVYTITFTAYSDGAYSDEDGLYPTTCGHTVLDNIVVDADTSDFEHGMDGWTVSSWGFEAGDFSNIEDLASLPAVASFCPCSLADSVLVFFDENGEHPQNQSNLAVSPWIDLRAGGDVGRPGKVLLFDVYGDNPLANNIFFVMKIRYYPAVCSGSGLLRTSEFLDSGIVFYLGELPFCNPVDAPRARDYSNVIPPHAEQVQVAWGVVNLCGNFGPSCTGVTNTTPWFDNIALGVFGSAVAPRVQTTALDRFQDNFAADGSLSPTSPGRIDVNRIKNGSTPAPGMQLGDTLVARGDGGNTEVRLVFRVRPGPFTSGAALASMTARWTAEPGLAAAYGGSWYSARMDTAQQGAGVAMAQWMSTFHEADPGFQGHDRALDANDPNSLANDILPDHIFTPGSRIDYFVAARYLPPDPRNPGGVNWFLDPDTTGAYFREVEILPSSMAADTTWNCTLYVDHHDDRGLADQAAEELGLRLFFGPGGANAEGTRHDRYDVQTPSSAQLSLGRPVNAEAGASLSQLLAYRAIAWHSGTLTSGQLTNEDAAILRPWLEDPAGYGRLFWGSGEGLMQSMQQMGGAAMSFLNDVLGVTQNCTSIRIANCPTGTAIDTTYCLPMAAVGGAHFDSSPLPRARGNGCPELLSFDLLNLNPAVPTAQGQLAYMKNGGARDFASVTNHTTTGAGYRTVLDGVSVGSWRSNAGYFEAGCNDLTASYQRTEDVLGWSSTSLLCNVTTAVSNVPDSEAPTGPAYRAALGAAFPNPTPGAARLSFVNAAPNARVRLDILDVSGRLVRTLVNGPLPAGPNELSWDGRAADGRPVADGLYFYRMTTDGFTEARKLVVLR